MLGHKRVNLSKDSLNQQNENTKKKTFVSGLARTQSLKIKETPSPVKKVTNLSSLGASAQPNPARTPAPLKSPSKQVRKLSGPSANSRTAPRSTPSLIKTPASSPRKSSILNRGSVTNVSRERSQPSLGRVANPDFTKCNSKTKTFRPKIEGRQPTSSLHSVVFIKDESKTFKERPSNKSKKPQTATLRLGSCKRPTNCTEPDDERCSTDCSSRTFDASNGSTTVRSLDGPDSRKTGYRGRLDATETRVDVIREPNRYGTENEVRASNVEIRTEMSVTREGEQKLTSEGVCVCDTEECSPLKLRETENPSHPTQGNNGVKCSDPKWDNADRVQEPECSKESFETHQRSCDGKTTGNPYLGGSVAGESENGAVSQDNVKGSDNETPITIQSKVSSILDEFGKKSSVENDEAKEGLQTSKDSVKETNACPSLSTLGDSFDTKTFIMERPFLIGCLEETSVGIDKESFQVKTESPTTLEDDCSKPASVESNLKVDALNDNGLSLKETLNDFQEVLEKNEFLDESSENILNNDVQVERTLFDYRTTDDREIFDCVDTLELLNVARICSGNDDVSDLSDNIIFTYLPAEIGERREVAVCEDDEFALESEEVVETVDVSDCVWTDYKMPLKEARREDDGIWLMDGSDSEGDEYAEDAVVLLEPENGDWSLTERHLEDLRACLDECQDEVEYTAKEIRQMMKRHPDRTPSCGRRFNCSMKSSKIDVNDIQIIDISETFSDPIIVDGTPQTATPRRGDDDLDYFSVSSGDELCDADVDLNPRKSYLSFGKSCSKMKKKSEKKVLLSFFNLFK